MSVTLGKMKDLAVGFVKACVFGAGLLAAGGAQAADPVQQHNSNAVWFENWIGLSNAVMVVRAPDGTLTRIEAGSGTPVFELDPAAAPDGVYRYEISAATEARRTIVNPQDNGRGEAESTTGAVPFRGTGQFVVERGVIVTPADVTEQDS